MPSISIPQLGRPTRGAFDKFTNFKPAMKFRVCAPMELADRVRPRAAKSKAVPCLQQMSAMMDCWKANDYNDSQCNGQIKAFYDCWAQVQRAKTMRQDSFTKGQVVGTSTDRLPSDYVNALLKKYPQPKSL